MSYRISYKQLDRITGHWVLKFKDVAEELRSKPRFKVGNPNKMRTIKKDDPYLSGIV